MFELLVLGTVGFWITLTLATIFIFISLESDEWGGTGATSTVIVLVVLFWFFGGKDIFIDTGNFLIENTGVFFLFFISYIIIGLIWSFVKWYFYLLNTKEKIQKSLKNNDFSIPKIPEVKNNKGRIISWITYWPFSSLWTIINDPIKRAINFMYSKFEKLYQKMSDNMFSDIKEEIKNKK